MSVKCRLWDVPLQKNAVAFQFKSKRNSSNVRLRSLLERSTRTRVIEFKGVRIGRLDLIFLMLLRVARSILYPFLRDKYFWLHVMGTEEGKHSGMNQVLHLDDPTFSPSERADLRTWFLDLESQGKRALVVCTFEGASKYVKSIDPRIEVEVIPQGFTPRKKTPIKFSRFSCVYSSPYIFDHGDSRINHPTWSPIHFLEDLLPRILELNDSIDVHIIGRLGKNAARRLSNYERVVLHGLLSPEVNAEIMAKCHVGLYPRVHDHGRRVLKITEYMGAGLPIVAYDLEDTKLVTEKELGFMVKTPEEFISAIDRLMKEPSLYQKIKDRTRVESDGLDWDTLAKKLDAILDTTSKL